MSKSTLADGANPGQLSMTAQHESLVPFDVQLIHNRGWLERQLPTLYAAVTSRWGKAPSERVCVKLRADAKTLYVGADSYPLASFTDAQAVYENQAPHFGVVRVVLRRGPFQAPVQLAAQNHEQAEGVLAALGFGLGRVRIRAGKWAIVSQSLFLVLCIWGAMFGADLFDANMSLIWLVWAVLDGLPKFLVVSYVQLGTDGIVTRRWGREKFIAYDQIAEVGAEKTMCLFGLVETGNDHVAVTLRCGRILRIVCVDGSKQLPKSLQHALHAHRQRAPVRNQSLVARGGRSHLEWVKTLRASLKLGAHRRAAVSMESLWRTIEDCASRAMDRAAAAVALGKQLAPGERVRLTRIASRVASPKLRIAMEHVAKQSDTDAIAEALGALETERAAYTA